MMPRLYKQAKSNNYYADLKVWSGAKQKMVRKRVSTGTDDEEKALLFAQALEDQAQALKPMANKQITKEHVHSVVKSLCAAMDISIEGDVDMPLIEDFFTRYNKVKERKLSVSSIVTYKTQLRSLLQWMPKGKKLDWLDVNKLEDYYAYLLKGNSPTTAKAKMDYVGRVLATATPEYLPNNPYKKITHTKQKDELKRLPMTMGEVDKILRYLLTQGSRGREWRIAVILAVSCGCRLEDAVAMSSSNLEGDLITYTQKKTGKTILCPIANKEWLKELQKVEGEMCPALYADYKIIKRSSMISVEFTAIVSEAGVKQEYHIFENSGTKTAKKTFHSLRHTLRTSIISSGGSDAQADLILGHSGNQGKTYTHSETDAMRKVLGKVFK